LYITEGTCQGAARRLFLSVNDIREGKGSKGGEGKERKGKERKGKERKGMERKGKERISTASQQTSSTGKICPLGSCICNLHLPENLSQALPAL